MLTYYNHQIVFQEVPNETTLAFSVGGCPYRCAGCHSPHLREEGERNLLGDIVSLLNHYTGMITCVCFFGGDHDIDGLMQALWTVRCFDGGIKTCLYSGRDQLDEDLHQLLPLLDYIKIGSYKQELGGLNSPATNQRFYRVSQGNLSEDITSMFYSKGDF